MALQEEGAGGLSSTRDAEGQSSRKCVYSGYFRSYAMVTAVHTETRVQ